MRERRCEHGVGMFVGLGADVLHLGVRLGAALHDQPLGVEELPGQAAVHGADLRQLALAVLQDRAGAGHRLEEAGLLGAERLEERHDIVRQVGRGLHFGGRDGGVHDGPESKSPG